MKRCIIVVLLFSLIGDFSKNAYARSVKADPNWKPRVKAEQPLPVWADDFMDFLREILEEAQKEAEAKKATEKKGAQAPKDKKVEDPPPAPPKP